MPSGGHGRGPAADPNSARSERRKDTAGWTSLPAEGRGKRARAPKFPLVGMTEVESDFWVVLWKKPQAVMWERMGMQLQVAAYTRAFLESVSGDASAGLKTAVLRMEGELGISLPGMHQMRWKFAEDEVAVKRSAPAAVVVEEPRSRFRGLDAAAS